MTPGTVRLDGKVAVVTGGTSGIGREVAQRLAELGARVVVVGRGGPRVEQVVAELRRVTGHPQVEGLSVDDLATKAAWGSVSATLRARYPQIHVLVQNAGGVFMRRETTVDGVERTWALNVLTPFALTAYLQDQLRGAAPARVVFVASAAHEGHHLDFEDVEGARSYRGFRAYGRSKLALILLSRELARRFAGSGVTVNSVHPGFIRSGFAQNNGGGTAAAIRFFALLFGKSVQRGARTPVLVATSPALEHVSGEYFSGEHIRTGSAASRDLTSAHRLYDVCRAMTGAPDIPLPAELSRAI